MPPRPQCRGTRPVVVGILIALWRKIRRTSCWRCRPASARRSSRTISDSQAAASDASAALGGTLSPDFAARSRAAATSTTAGVWQSPSAPWQAKARTAWSPPPPSATPTGRARFRTTAPELAGLHALGQRHLETASFHPSWESTYRSRWSRSKPSRNWRSQRHARQGP